MTHDVRTGTCCVEGCSAPAAALDVACRSHVLKLIVGALDAEGQLRIDERRRALPATITRLRLARRRV